MSGLVDRPIWLPPLPSRPILGRGLKRKSKRWWAKNIGPVEKIQKAVCPAGSAGIMAGLVALSGGGGQLTRTETVLTDTEALTGGGGLAVKTETVITETVVLALL